MILKLFSKGVNYQLWDLLSLYGFEDSENC